MKHHKLFNFNIKTLILGMGGTGLSCARYLQQRHCLFDLADSRTELPHLEAVITEFSESNIINGDFNFEVFKTYQQIIVRPGIAIRSELFTLLENEGCVVLGDIELFAQVVDQPVIAITGSNGKSTVTTLVENMAQACGIKAIAGGNLGIPALDLLASKSDVYILELSSFQLETMWSLQTLSATVLNVSDDHMDRYNNLDDYRQVKERIYQHTKNAVFNADETLTLQRVKKIIEAEEEHSKIILFGEENHNDRYDYTLRADNSLWCADNKLFEASELKIKGRYNYLNILAALALLKPLHLDKQAQINAIKAYKGLEHRCEWVKTIAGIAYYNDSKGTNTGATIAAINAFSENKQNGLILIAGGVAKNADFRTLGNIIKKKVKFTILIGIDALQIKQCALLAGADNDHFYHANSMNDAVFTANTLAHSGDMVLLSPACASFDMYHNYIQRGDDFKKNVDSLEYHLKETDNVC